MYKVKVVDDSETIRVGKEGVCDGKIKVHDLDRPDVKPLVTKA